MCLFTSCFPFVCPESESNLKRDLDLACHHLLKIQWSSASVPYGIHEAYTLYLSSPTTVIEAYHAVDSTQDRVRYDSSDPSPSAMRPIPLQHIPRTGASAIIKGSYQCIVNFTTYGIGNNEGDDGAREQMGKHALPLVGRTRTPSAGYVQ